jgi:hypothetical protein
MDRRALVALVMGITLALTIIFYSACPSLPYGLEASDILQAAYPLIAFAAFTATYFLYRKWKSDIATAWLCLTAATLLWFLGYASYAALEIITRELPYPSISDAFWLLAYMPAMYGLFLLFRSFAADRPRFVALAAAIFAVGASLALYLLLPPALAEPDLAIAAIGLAYPLFDCVLLAFAVPIAAMLLGRPNALPWLALSAGFSFMAVADMGFAAFTLIGTYDYCHPINFFFVSGFALLALGAYLRKSEK